MIGVFDRVDTVAHVIQIALTPVFLFSGISSLLSVLATRLGRVADHVDLRCPRSLRPLTSASAPGAPGASSISEGGR